MLYSLWKQFTIYTTQHHPLNGMSDLNDSKDTCPWLCAAWIMSLCDPKPIQIGNASVPSLPPPSSTLPLIKTENSSKRMRKGKPATYSHAVKMRSALSFGFVQYMDKNPTVWQKLPDGTNWGNPSLSTVVTTYMKSLRKKKVYTLFL